MKKCPFCAEEIQDEAIKCKHCNEFLDASRNPHLPREKIPWYFNYSFIIIALFCVGPLALPLIWWRPKMPLSWKIGVTVVVLVISWFMYLVTVESVRSLMQYYQMLESL